MSQSREVHTRGIIINRFSSGEGSVQARIFTEELGLVGAVARSAREERSKLRAHLMVGTFGNFDLVQGAQVWRVVGAVRTKNSYFGFVDNPEAQNACARVLSLLRQLVRGEERDEELFGVVWNFFEALPAVPRALVAQAERLAVLHILTSLGYVSKKALALEHYSSGVYTALETLAPYEADMRHAIKEGFAASGLISG